VEPPPSTKTVDEQPLIVDQEHANQADFERHATTGPASIPIPTTTGAGPPPARIEECVGSLSRRDGQHAGAAGDASHHLHDQLSNYDLTEAERIAADKVIYNLDANGYLPMPLAELIDPDGPGDQLQHLEKALGIVQSMDPAGVGARDLKECLLLQIRSDMPHGRQLRRLITRSPGRPRRQSAAAHREENGLHDRRDRAAPARSSTGLQPKPGSMFLVPVVPPVKPDVYVDQQADGTWKVRLEEVDLPNLRISPTYREMLMSPATDPATRDYIKRKINAAQWLIELDRAAPRPTLLKTAQAIVDHQTRFSHRRPGGDRAAQDAADRRPDRHARDHGEPGRGRQMAADATRAVSAAAVLRGRHRRPPTATRWHGIPCG